MMKKNQQGGVLLEALVSLTIFALGIVGLLGSMTVTSHLSSDNRFRTEAVLMADELLGQMAVSDPSTLPTEFGPSSPRIFDWVRDRVKTLPGGTTIINFRSHAAAAGGTFVTITINWRQPNAPVSAPRGQYITTTYFR